MKKLLLFSLLAFAAACGSESKGPGNNNTETPPPSSPAAPAVTKVEYELYRVSVNNLLLRNEPTQKSTNVLAKLQAGDIVTGTGVQSDTKEQAEIRGITMEMPYYQVTTIGGNPRTGWAFGGALQRLYSGAQAGAPDPAGKIQLFSNRLKTLEAKNLDSAKRAWEYVRTNLGDVSGPTADAVLIQLEDFLRTLNFQGELYNLTEKQTWTDDDMMAVWRNSFDMQKYPVTRQLTAAGYTLATAEGMVFPEIDWTQIQAFFGPKVTPPMRTFIAQQLEEFRNVSMSDGGIVTGLDTIVDRAAFWEKFNRENPHFPLREQTRESEAFYKLTLTNGGDNTPAFGWEEDHSVNPEFRKAWEYAVKQYPGTATAQAAQQMLNAAQKDGWKQGANVEAVQKNMADSYMSGR